MTGRRIPILGGARAVILHRPHDVAEALARQLGAIGLRAERHWPDLPCDAAAADFLFFDADMGFDAQFPWKPGRAPMPTIALIGSEAPGRVEWALSHAANAQLLKPLGSGGVYSSLLIARQSFEHNRSLQREVARLRARLEKRESIVRASAALAGGEGAEVAGFARLRSYAMDHRLTMEEAASRVLAGGRAGWVAEAGSVRE